jgi:hypothetical protein
MAGSSVGAETPVGTTIVERIAALEGIDPLDLTVPLYDVIDPEALDSLVTANREGDTPNTLRIQFTYNGHVVTVDGSGEIDID